MHKANAHTNRGTRLNWREACKILGCGKTKFYDLVNNGDLPAYRINGGRLWVWEEDCYALIKPLGSGE